MHLPLQIETVGLTKENIDAHVETYGRGFIEKWDEYIKIFTDIPTEISKLKTAQSPIEELKEKLDDTKLEVEKAESELVNLNAKLLEGKNNVEKALLENQLVNQKNALKSAELEQKIKEAKESLMMRRAERHRERLFKKLGML